MQASANNWFKVFIGFIVCLLVRLLPFRPPNIEPILATQMPFSKAYGKWVGFMFGLSSIVLFDLVTGSLGAWTFFTAISYGLIGLWAGVYFKKRANNATTYVGFAIISTIVYDAITGLTIGPFFFHQHFVVAVIGQIPFTMLHLLGNISFAFVLSPPLYQYLSEDKTLKISSPRLLKSQTYNSL